MTERDFWNHLSMTLLSEVVFIKTPDFNWNPKFGHWIKLRLTSESQEQDNRHLLSSQHHSQPINNFFGGISDTPIHRKSKFTSKEKKLSTLIKPKMFIIILLGNPKSLAWEAEGNRCSQVAENVSSLSLDYILETEVSSRLTMILVF